MPMRTGRRSRRRPDGIVVGLLLLALVLPLPVLVTESACASPSVSPAAPLSASGAGTAPAAGPTDPGCSVVLHTVMGVSGSCLPCGAATLAAQPFLPTEALEDGLPPMGLRSPLGPLSLPWRPPA